MVADGSLICSSGSNCRAFANCRPQLALGDVRGERADCAQESRQWRDLKVSIAGPKVAAYLDGKLYLEHVLPEPVSGRIGLWSKADSHMYFDDFTVTPAD